MAAPPPYDNEILLEQEWGIVMMRSIGPLELLTLLVAIAVLAIVVAFPAGRICRRAGYSPWLGLLALIPVCNVILLWFLAFAEWPGRRDA